MKNINWENYRNEDYTIKLTKILEDKFLLDTTMPCNKNVYKYIKEIEESDIKSRQVAKLALITAKYLFNF